MKRYTAKGFEPVTIKDVVPGRVYRDMADGDILMATDEESHPLVCLDSGCLYSTDFLYSGAKYVEVEATYIVEDDDEE